jgi:aconitate hydratase
MNSFDALSTHRCCEEDYQVYRLDALKSSGIDVQRLPYSLRILLENLLRHEDGKSVTADDIIALGKWDPKAEPSIEISFTPARVLLQDFTGVPCVVDLAAMRDAMARLGGDPKKINPLQPVELVIDHSVQVDAYGSEAAILINRDLEFERNMERYAFLKWGQKALRNFKVVPPNTGIVHQVNLEHLARVAFVKELEDGGRVVYPDTLVGTDSHTTMINGLGVLGWGVGGIEAEAAMLGQPVSMLIPQVIGFRLSSRLPEGATATDLVLVVTEMLRKKGVVGKFVEFFGPGLRNLPLADRATIGNMSPEFGATCAIFPVDDETLKYMRLTARPDQLVALTESYFKTQGMFADYEGPQADYSDILELDLRDVEPSVAGPRRPQDRAALGQARASFAKSFPHALGTDGEGGLLGKMLDAVGLHAKPATTGSSGAGSESGTVAGSAVALEDAPSMGDEDANAAADQVRNGSVVIAAITSCTNTSNPYVMTAAGLLAKKAVEFGLKSKPWVKTSLAPGSRVVTDIYERAGLLQYLEELRFHVVGYGCTTCIGNSGPLPERVAQQINDHDLVVASVLSGNRNFEGRINSDVKANYLMSPPLVVAYALAGTMDIDLTKDPLGTGSDGRDIYLRDIWPTQHEIADAVAGAVHCELFEQNYANVFDGDDKWQAIDVEPSDQYHWDPDSTYIKNPPYFKEMEREAPERVADLQGMRVLALLGDSITTDHISPAGSIKLNSPAGEYLTEHDVKPAMFNSYGSRRGNHQVMVRGTFANVRLRNKVAPETEGGFTCYFPSGEITTIYHAAQQYRNAGIPLMVVAGKEYGSGSSRDWAAKGSYLLGVKTVLAESFERIHRSNLVGMGILPLEFMPGDSAAKLGLEGDETFDVVGLADAVASEFASGRQLTVRSTKNGQTQEFQVKVRIDTPQEIQYYRHGGILQYVLRSLL